jgi:PAS domain S-box-containing protein
MSHLLDNQLLSAIFDRASESIFVIDQEGRHVRVNAAAERLTGYSNEELATMTFFDLTPQSSLERGRSLWREFLRRGALTDDYWLRRKDGSVVQVEFQAVANFARGLHLSCARDVTARRREERRLRRAVNLQEATAAMSAAVDTAQVAKAILAAGLNALDAQAGHVVAVVDGGRWAELVATVGMPPGLEEQWAAAASSLGVPPKIVDGRYRFWLDDTSVLLRGFRPGDPVCVEQVGDLRSRENYNLSDVGGAMVGLPLLVSGTPVGGLYLFWKEKRSFCADESSFAWTLAGLCAQALERARLFTAEREARERAVASEKSILEYQQRLQRMAFDRVVVEERERRRVAMALHDGVTQYLALARITLDPVRQRLEEANRKAVDSAVELITQAIDETRSLSFELSPPVLYDLGIKAGLCWLGEKLEQATGLHVEIADDGTDPSVDDVTAAILFRSVRELLMNVFKHAKSKIARVSLGNRADHVEVVVEDTGAGFEPAQTSSSRGFGLMSVREEIGRLGGVVEVISAPDRGTRIRMRVPSRLADGAGSPDVEARSGA